MRTSGETHLGTSQVPHNLAIGDSLTITNEDFPEKIMTAVWDAIGNTYTIKDEDGRVWCTITKRQMIAGTTIFATLVDDVCEIPL